VKIKHIKTFKGDFSDLRFCADLQTACPKVSEIHSSSRGRPRRALEQLLVLVESVEHGRLVSIFTNLAGEYRQVGERPGKGNKAVERCVISTFHVVESMGFKGRVSSAGTPVADRRFITASLTRTRDPTTPLTARSRRARRVDLDRDLDAVPISL
jgi:hypothetical protein